MFISVGWYCLAGGIWGAIKVAIAKRFFKADFANLEGVITEEDRRTEVTITPMKRWLIVVICAALAILGVLWIQHDNNWNPFQG
jgi:hypothetical protein